MPRKSPPRSRLPEWIRVSLPKGAAYGRTAKLMRGLCLHTVCEEAKCPNIFECFAKSTATFLVLGPECTRNCAFCNVTPGAPPPPDQDEPQRLAKAAETLKLNHVVITSVTRDDLPDGGANHFAACIDALRRALPKATVEVLIPDFQGDPEALKTVLAARPDVLNHNLETVPHLYPRIRPQADYAQSLQLLARAREHDPDLHTKSGFMLGLGETTDQAKAVVNDLHNVGITTITIGQYLRPSAAHPEPERYAHPDEFQALADHAASLGVPHTLSAPLVRSSYHAADLV